MCKASENLFLPYSAKISYSSYIDISLGNSKTFSTFAGVNCAKPTWAGMGKQNTYKAFANAWVLLFTNFATS